MGSSKALALLLGLGGLGKAISQATACQDYTCPGVLTCDEGLSAGVCAAPLECPSTDIQFANGVVQVRGWRCRVTLEQIRLAYPEVLTKEITDAGTEYTLNNRLWLRDGAILEIHGPSQASSQDTAVSLLKLKVRGRERESRI